MRKRAVHLTATGKETACGLNVHKAKNWLHIARTYARPNVTCKRCRAAMRSPICRDWGHL